MKLQLSGYFGFFLKGHPRFLEVPLTASKRLVTILSDLGLPVGEILLVAVNGELVNLENAEVSDSDEVKLYPPMDGG